MGDFWLFQQARCEVILKYTNCNLLEHEWIRAGIRALEAQIDEKIRTSKLGKMLLVLIKKGCTRLWILRVKQEFQKRFNILTNFWNSQNLLKYFTVPWPGSGTRNNTFLTNIYSQELLYEKKWDNLISRYFSNFWILLKYFTITWPSLGKRNKIFLSQFINENYFKKERYRTSWF